MERIEWTPSFSVGVEELDQQHKQIVDLINQLITDADATVRSETISELLTKLTAYAGEHFRTEEDLLKEYKYPGLVEQNEDHRTYRRKIGMLCQDTMDHRDSVPAEALRFMVEWWVQHILETDMKYRSFLLEHGVK